MFAVLLVVLVAALCALAYWQHQRTVKRREALFTFAVARGWAFTVADDSYVDRWIGTPFGQGEHRHATNIICGSTGNRSFVAFDYEYVTKSSGSSNGQQLSTHRYSVVAVGMQAYLPTLEVTPESVVDRVGEAVGLGRDVELESEDFNRKYRVSAYDPKFATDVLCPRTMEMLLARPSLAFRIQGTDAISWEVGTIEPLDVVARTSTLDAVLDAIPGYVWRDHGATA